MDTQNYKRTLAGSVGAGMGALLGASGRTYYILEHKASSKYHQAGEVQKIIVDQVEMGRDASCQVRFDESFETVSRKHAAIVREGENWKLIHLSHSNPTLVNGNVINGSYYLQTGDEIQLSGGGPRLGFIVPQGKQALTSSIGLTERMNLFRKQALRPYKMALTVMGIVLVLALAGLGTWNYTLGKKNAALVDVVDGQKEQMSQYKLQLDSLGNERNRLEQEQRRLEQQVRESDGDKEMLKSQLSHVREQLNYVNSVAYKANSEMETLKNELAKNQKELEEKGVVTKMNEEEMLTTDSNEIDLDSSSEETSIGASMDLRDYYDHIYTIKIDRINVEKNGISFDPGIQLTDIVCGTGFMLNNGDFVTDRQNVEPWIYGDEQWKEDWRRLMAECVGAGCNVIIHYRAYSTKGTGKPLTFVNTDFKCERSGDCLNFDFEVRRELRSIFKKYDIEPEYTRRNYVKATILAPKVCQWAVIRQKGIFGEGIPYDAEASTTLKGGSEIHMVGYAGSTDEHNPVPAHFNDRTNIDDTQYGTIILQNRVGEHGYYGSPAFIKKSNGTYQIVGVMLGSVSCKDRLVPIDKLR